MESYVSNVAIQPTDNIIKSIFENIINNDFLIFLINSDTISSSWMKWEHDFCKERNILPLYVVFPSMFGRLNELSYLDQNDYRINFDGYVIDILLDKIASTVFNKKNELETFAKSRNKIKITAQTNLQNYKPNEQITISGNIDDQNSQSLDCNFKLFLHIPGLRPSEIPQSKTMVNSFNIDTNRNFQETFTLPSGVSTSKIQTWYVEVRANNQSKLIPITICPPDGISSVSDASDGETPTESVHLPSPSNIEQIRQKIESISEGTVQSISRQILDQEIPRTNTITKIISQLDHDDRVVITGDKGIGKSVLFSQLYSKLHDLYRDVLFIRCDDFLGIESINDLERIIDADTTFSDIIKNWPNDSRFVILFDSLDAISRNTKTIGIFKQFLKILWGTNKVKTICSVRSYDYEYSPLIATTDWGFPIPLDELTNEELEGMLIKLGNPIIPTTLKKILKNPLRLKLLSLIMIKNQEVDFSKITNEIELYHEHWKEYVEKQEHQVEITKTLFDIAEKMVSEQKILLPQSKLESSLHLDEIGSRNIVKISNSQIQFFHHAYLDYVVSKLILEKYQSITKYIKQDEYNVFLRPTIIFTLSLLHAQNKKKYLESVIEICKSTLKYYWKISTVKSLSEVEDFEEVDVKPLGTLFTEDLALQRHFLSEISKRNNSFWFRIWTDTFLTEWYSKENGNGQYLVEYLKAIDQVPDLHEKILLMAKFIVKKQEHPQIKKRAIEATSEISAKNKSSWYLELSKNSESQVRSGSLSCLMSLIEVDPKTTSEVFYNIYTFEEKSDEKTSMLSYGTLGFTSTKKQDNQQVLWECGEVFPKLFEKNNITMTKSVIQIFEKIHSEHIVTSDESIVEDFNYIWYDKSEFSHLHDENKLVSLIEEYLKDCSKDEIIKFIPILQNTRLALFHKILLNMFLRYPEEFYIQIFEEISHQVAIKITSLEVPVRNAINRICLLLEQSQVEILLNNIMTLEFDKKDFDDEQYKRILNKIKARYLSEFDESLLSETHKTLLSEFSKQSLIPEPPVEFSIKMSEPEPKPPKESPEDIIDKNIDQEIDFNKKIELLDSMVEYLGGKTEELDKEKLEKIKKYLIENKDSANPEDNSVDKDVTFIMGHQTIRGLVARGIIRLFYHTKDQSLKELIIQLSNDNVNIVRGEIGKELSYLFFVDYPLTLDIALRYSKETDNRVLFYLSGILRYTVNKSGDDTTQIIKNILTISGTKNYRYIQNLEYILLHLSLKKQHVGSKALLDEIISSHEEYATVIRRNIPFILKEHYLHDPETQNFSLEVFLTLSNDKDHEVREASSFFLLHSIEESKESDLVQLIEKISPHLDIIAKEVDKRPWQPKIIENLIYFLEKFWEHIPGETLDYLEKISSIKEYSPYQPIFARGTITMLNGIFQLPALSKEDRNRSLAILDIFAMAGWPEALNLLSVMERPD